MFNYDEILSKVLINESASKLANLNEEAKSNALDKVSVGLFKDIIEKASRCDFSVAEKSKGDINKISCHKDIDQVLKIIKRMSFNPNADMELKNAGSTLEKAYKALRDNAQLFKQSFTKGNKMVQYIYCSFATTFITCCSLVSVKASKVLSNGSYNTVERGNIPLDSNSGMKGLAALGDAHAKGKLKKSLETALDLKKAMREAVEMDSFGPRKQVYGLESVHDERAGEKFLSEESYIEVKHESISVMAVIATIGALAWLLFNVRSLVYYYFLLKVKLADYISQLSYFVKMNSTTQTDEKIRNRQEKIASKLEALSERIQVDSNVASERSKEEVESSNKDINTEYSSQNSTNGDLGVF